MATSSARSGGGTRRIMLLAHMDTVYLKGMLAKQPFRIDGNRAYGLGIGDDKAGIAVILHTLSVLKETNFRGYGKLTVLINGDEEVSSPGSRNVLSKRSLSRWCNPIDGSSRMYITPTRPAPIWLASRIR